MIKKIFLLVLTVITVSACSVYHITSEDTATEYFPSKISINEVIYLETVDRPHQNVGKIMVNTERNQHIHEVLERMKREAAIMGADAITNIETDATGTWKRLPVQEVLGNGYVRANFTATAVIFK
jgi:uncharacterized protein YbjQ (UPF0145 family)